MRPRNSAVDPIDRALAEALGEAAELLAERHEGRQRLHLLRADSGDVDRIGDDASGQRRGHLLGGDDTGAVLRLGGRGAQVRGYDDVLAGEDRVLGKGLGREDVERRAADLSGLQPGFERVEVDQLAACAVDDPHAVPHRHDRLGVDQVDRVRCLRHVQGDDVGAARRGPRGSRRPRRPARGSARRRRTCRSRRRPSRSPGPAWRRAGRCGRSRPRRASFRTARSPLNLERSQRPSTREPWARGTLRQRARASARVCSAAATEFDSGALATMMPRRVAAGMSTLSTPVPARPIAFSRSPRSISSAVILRRRADQDRVVLGDRLPQLLVGHLEAELDVEVLPQQLDAGVGDLLLDEDLHLATPSTFSIVQSMQAVSASTSAGSTAGNMPTRSWLRPSLR